MKNDNGRPPETLLDRAERDGRRYSVEVRPGFREGQYLGLMLRCWGPGHWCVAHGEPAYMTSRVMGLFGTPFGPTKDDGKYLKSFDPEAHDGRGAIVLTDDAALAMRFEEPLEAFRLYQSVPKCHPIRKTDGRPNRPLTAYHWEFLSIP
jgi:hypothetical protein